MRQCEVGVRRGPGVLAFYSWRNQARQSTINPFSTDIAQLLSGVDETKISNLWAMLQKKKKVEGGTKHQAAQADQNS